MLRRLFGLALLLVPAAVAAVIADRFLAARRGAGSIAPLTMLVVIDAPIDTVWALVADIPLQPEWMHEMKSVTVDPPGPARAGTRGEATVRVMGISVTDVVEVTAVEPPHRFSIRHTGTFIGHGDITLEAGADGSTTIVRWEELLVPPLLPDLGALVQAPILQGIFQADLQRLKRLAETGSAD